MLELIEILKFFKGIFSWIYTKIGIVGLIIIILLITCVFEYHVIEKRDTSITTLQNKIKEQNDSIAKASKEHDALVVRVKDAEDKNVELDAKYQTLLTKLRVRPIAKNCPDAINEVKDSSLQNAELWNSGSRK